MGNPRHDGAHSAHPNPLQHVPVQLFDAMNEGVVLVDAAGCILFFNEAARQMVGFESEPVRGRFVHRVLCWGPSSAARQDAPSGEGAPASNPDCEVCRKLLGDAVHRNCTARFRGSDGSPVAVRYSVFPYRGQGGDRVTALTFHGATVDQTDQQLERFHAIIEQTPEYISISEPDGSVVYLNKTGRKWLNLTQEQPIPAIRHTESIARQAAEQGAWQGERQQFLHGLPGVAYTPDVLQTMVAHKNPQGEVEFYSTIAIDISEQKRLEEERSRLLAIIEDTPDIVSTSDVDGQILYYNKAGRRLLRLGPDDDISHLEVGQGHPDWVARVVKDEGIPTAIREGVWQGETAVIDPDGREIPVLQVIIAHKDEHGNVKYISTILRDISQRKRMEEDLHYLATHDALTGALNRACFQDHLQIALDRAKRHEQAGALLFLDLDNFKEINDTFGHHAGDELLRQIALTIQDNLRSGDLLARLGGDEFAVLLPNIHLGDAEKIGRRLLGAIRSETIESGDRAVGVSGSLGVAAYPAGAATAEDLLIRADSSMYDAKRRGGNGLSVYDGKSSGHGT